MWLVENSKLHVWLTFMGYIIFLRDRAVLSTIPSTKNRAGCEAKSPLSKELTFQGNAIPNQSQSIKIGIFFIIWIANPFIRKRCHTTWAPELAIVTTLVPGSCTESSRTHGQCLCTQWRPKDITAPVQTKALELSL